MKRLLLLLCCILLTTSAFGQETLKVGYVNMNTAINQSKEGKRSKKFLEMQARRAQDALKSREQELKQMESELRNNIMLNQEAKAKKQKEIEQKKAELRKELASAQKGMRQDELRHTTKIFKDLVLVIKEIAEEEGFDVILEFNVKQTILYSRFKMTDLTDKVTERYDRIQAIQ